MWWSFLLAAVGIIGLILAGKKLAVGWLVGLAAQVLWIFYGCYTHQWGFIFSALAYGAVYAKNAWSWYMEQAAEEMQ